MHGTCTLSSKMGWHDQCTKHSTELATVYMHKKCERHSQTSPLPTLSQRSLVLTWYVGGWEDPIWPRGGPPWCPPGVPMCPGWLYMSLVYLWEKYVGISSIRRHGFYFFLLHIWCGYYSRVDTIRGWCLFLWKALRHQRWLDKVHMMTVTHFQ